MEKCSQRTENFTVLSLEFTSIVYFRKIQTHYPHQVLLSITYSKGTLMFDNLGIGVDVCLPYPNQILLM